MCTAIAILNQSSKKYVLRIQLFKSVFLIFFFQSQEEYRIIHDTLKSFIQLESGENVYYNQLSRVTPEATSV